MARFKFSLVLTSVSLFLNLSTAAPTSTSCSSPDLSSLQTFSYKPRIFVLSDILNEPDDSMSLVRYLLYANEFDTRGLCAVTSTWLRNSTHPEQMRAIVNAYGEVVDTLNNHVHPNFTYQPADYFLNLITSGPAVYGKQALNTTLSEGASRLIAALQESSEPLYVPVWGGINTLAQALQHMEQTLSPSAFATERSKLRVYTISDQDDTGAWIRARFPDISYIVSVHNWNDYSQAAWVGMNSGPGPDQTKVLNPWLDANIRLGTLGAVYPQVVYGMEGDTPSWIWLVQNGLGQRENIEWGGWGGRYARAQAVIGSDGSGNKEYDSNLFVNTVDTAIGADGVTSYKAAQAGIWRWRDAMQDDFAARMQWTLTSNFAEAGHPPVVSINGSQGLEPLILGVADAETNANGTSTFVLDASGSYNPDCRGTDTNTTAALDYAWLLYTDVTTSSSSVYPGVIGLEPLAAPLASTIVLNNTAGFANYTLGPVVKVTAPPAVVNAQTGMPMPDFHVVLQVTNSAGSHPIRRYKRVIFKYHD